MDSGLCLHFEFDVWLIFFSRVYTTFSPKLKGFPSLPPKYMTPSYFLASQQYYDSG